MFLKMAAVNLVKHRTRTVLILFAVMVSVLVMEVVAGMFHGIRANFFETLTRQDGHVQVTAEGYRDALNPFSLDYTISDYERIAEALVEIAGARQVEPILHFGGLLQHGERSITLSGVGVEQNTGFYSHVSDGLVHGEFPPPAGGVVVSVANAELLRAQPDDDLLLVVEDSTGSPYYMQYRIAGLFETAATEFDENTLLLSHSDAQELVYLEDATVELRVRLDEPDRADEFVSAARHRLGDADELEFRTYRELNAGLMSMIDMMDFFVVFMNLFVVVVAASVITNAILMNVFERVREFGTMRAIGLKKRGVLRIVLTEGVLQGCVGSLLGLAVGVPVVLYFSVNGIDMGGIAEAFGMGSSEFRFAYSPRNTVLNGLGGLAIALAGSLYAAFVAARLSIMEALRYE